LAALVEGPDDGGHDRVEVASLVAHYETNSGLALQSLGYETLS
jgi:hypothetical protein